MLVRFRSSATDSITMFGESATDLIKLMGASGKVPGALNAEDVPEALRRLEAAIEDIRAATHETAAPPADNEDAAAEDDEEEKPREVSLATRAIPLLSLLKRAAAANAEVMWEPG